VLGLLPWAGAADERSMSKTSQRGGAAANERPGPPARRSFSDRARRAALLHTQGHSRKQIAELIGVAPETISVWKRHPQWQRELDRWRELAETPLDATQMRLKLESLEAMTTALEQLQLLMGATKPVSTGGTVSEQPDWQTRLKACRLVLAITFAVIPEFQDQHRQTPVDHRTLRVDR
jgi:transposase-like protein